MSAKGLSQTNQLKTFAPRANNDFPNQDALQPAERPEIHRAQDAGRQGDLTPKLNPARLLQQTTLHASGGPTGVRQTPRTMERPTQPKQRTRPTMVGRKRCPSHNHRESHSGNHPCTSCPTMARNEGIASRKEGSRR